MWSKEKEEVIQESLYKKIFSKRKKITVKIIKLIKSIKETVPILEKSLEGYDKLNLLFNQIIMAEEVLTDMLDKALHLQKKRQHLETLHDTIEDSYSLIKEHNEGEPFHVTASDSDIDKLFLKVQKALFSLNLG